MLYAVLFRFPLVPRALAVFATAHRWTALRRDHAAIVAGLLERDAVGRVIGAGPHGCGGMADGQGFRRRRSQSKIR